MSSRILAEIAALDPERDYQKICFLSNGYHFPYDNHKALEFALFRTYCVPSIGALLHATGEFENRPQRRYDDTVLLIAEFCEHGLDSERGRKALARMHQIHARFKISNADYLYVLSTFILEPIRWNERYGWRRLLAVEKRAAFNLWREIGVRMGIKDIPGHYAELEAYNIQYEREHFQFNEGSQRVGAATMGLFTSWFPEPLQPLVRQAALALLDEPVLKAFGFPAAHPLAKALVPGALKALAVVRRWLPERRRPLLRTGQKWRSYPRGYVIDRLGPS